MICQHCGATISDGGNFCIYCGMAQEGVFASPAQQTIRPIKLNLAQLLEDTFTLYGRHFGTMCMVGLILVGVSTIFGVCSALTKENIPLMLLITFFGMLPILYVAIMGFRQCLCTIRSGTGFQPNLLFSPLTMYLKYLGFCFVIWCVLMGCTMVLFVPLGFLFVIVGALVMQAANVPPLAMMMTAFIFGVCIACVAMIYPMVRLWLAPYFLVDRNMGIFDSLKISWQVSAGNFWTLCIAIIVFFGCLHCWNIPCAVVSHFVWGANSVHGVLLSGIGGIFLCPIICLGGALAYLQLTGEPHYLETVHRYS